MCVCVGGGGGGVTPLLKMNYDAVGKYKIMRKNVGKRRQCARQKGQKCWRLLICKLKIRST